MNIQFQNTFRVVKREFEKREDGEFHYIGEEILYESGSWLYAFRYCSMFLKKLLGYWVYKTEIEEYKIEDGKLVNDIVLYEDSDYRSIEWLPKKHFENMVGLRGIEDSEFWLLAYKRAMKLEFEHNFVKTPFNDGNSYYAYGIKNKIYTRTPNGEWI